MAVDSGLLTELLVTADAGASGAAAGGGISAGTAAAVAGGAAAGTAGGLALSGGSNPTTGGSPSATSGSSAGPGGQAPKPGFFGNLVSKAAPSIAGGVASAGLSAALGGRRGVTVPPPPGSAMIDQEGIQAAAMIRARQAAAGGLNSTITGAGNNEAGFVAATSGGKALLGS